MKNYFEGLYFKQQTEECAIAFIPALHTDKDGRTASLQIVAENKAFSVSYPIASAELKRQEASFAIGNNHFSLDGIHLDVHDEGIDLIGDLKFSALTRPKYDIMGPFRFVPFMECRHSVLSVRHDVSGAIVFNGGRINFEEGTGYIEGDRGRSFPKRYIWSQCLHEDISLMLSAADIPLLGGSFTGIIGIIYFRGQEYRISTYLGARPVFIGRGIAIVRQGDYTFTAQLKAGASELLKAPVRGSMTRRIRESISSCVRYRFSKGNEELFDFTSDCASFEDEYQ
ncbi:MAG: tocopherol cyclase family protein [Oscillospiraceae bacterium]